MNSNNYNPAAYNGQAGNYQAYHTPVPKIYQWNLAVQRELKTNLVAELGYVASHGYELAYPTDLNAIPQSKLSSNDSPRSPVYELSEHQREQQ